MQKFIYRIIIPLVLAIIAAVGGRFYDDIRIAVFPEEMTGDWVGIGGDLDSKTNTMKTFQERIHFKGSGGKISGQGAPGNYTWVYSGYLRHGYHRVCLGVKVASDA